MSNSPECPCLTIPQGHEEHLIPYSVVQPVYVQTKRPVIFSPSILSHGLIERLLQPAESGLIFDTCSPGTCTAIALYEPLGRPKHDGEKEFFFLELEADTPAICFPWFAEHIAASERREETVFLLDSCSPEHTRGIRLQSIQEAISQVNKMNLLFRGLSYYKTQKTKT